MNERIQQLAEQAGSTHKQNLGVYQFYADELEKFAELIVRECIDIVSAGGEFASRPKLVEKLQEHFGVEE
jgi:2,4-dienoyl-CoA reductase-like NADH-dependent reductase (Old Yellow Enzyme family)